MSELERERQLFEACLDLDSGEREAYLEEACEGDAALRSRICRLLASHQNAQSIPGDRRNAAPEIGDAIGPFRIVRVLGEGGMGIVYEAKQEVPIRRRVALKLIKPGLATSRVVARFEAERQALAFMDHPNIAKVFDAGLTPDGRPYFVMELVEGVSICDFCTEHQLTVRERLELFIPLCQAVQHAHQKGIIHRDLKPSNVLVRIRDGGPVPKVIDFGIAKADRDPGSDAVVTHAGMTMGTPAYMSPEQARTSVMDVDTRTDIHALGVMLYEILVGALPIDPAEMGIPAFIGRLAEGETDPPKPSSRLIETSRLRGNSCAGSPEESRRLLKELRGDLDWIVMKAIAVDRDQRYQTANALSMELQRYLSGEPVLARPPSIRYRLRKFLRRNRHVAAAAAVAVAAVLIAIIGITAGWIKATNAREVAVQEATRARKAELTAKGRLRMSLLAQARAIRRSYIAGRRQRALELLTQAASIEPGADLRDEAIACETLTDLQIDREWKHRRRDEFGLAFDAENERYASVSDKGLIEIRKMEDDSVLNRLPGDGIPAWVAQFDPSGRYLAAKYHGEQETENPRLRLWDLELGRALLTLPVTISGNSIDFDGGGRWLAYGTTNSSLILYDLKSRRIAGEIPLRGLPRSIRFSPDGRFIAVSLFAPARVDILRVQDGESVRRLEHGGALAAYISWDSTGEQLGAAYSDFSASVWRVDSGKEAVTLKGHNAEVVEIEFHPSLPLAMTYSWDETSRLWNTVTGKEQLVMQARAMKFSADGRFLSFVKNDSIGVWEVVGGRMFRTLYGHEGKGPLALAVSSDGKWIISGGEKDVIVWDRNTGQAQSRLASDPVNDILTHATGSEFFVCTAGGLTPYILPEGAKANIRQLEAIPGTCASAARDEAGGLWALLRQGKIALFGMPFRRDFGVIDGFPGIAQVSLSPDGSWVAAGNWRGAQTQVWESKTARPVAKLLPGVRAVKVRFSPDNRFLLTGSSDDYRLWETGTWKEKWRIARPERFSHLPGEMAFASDARFAALALDHDIIEMVRTEDAEIIARFEVPESAAFTELAFTPDGEALIAATSYNQIHLWNLKLIWGELARLGLYH
jgi:serine/threonine protein kinase/WD40 repeat protein